MTVTQEQILSVLRLTAAAGNLGNCKYVKLCGDYVGFYGFYNWSTFSKRLLNAGVNFAALQSIIYVQCNVSEFFSSSKLLKLIAVNKRAKL